MKQKNELVLVEDFNIDTLREAFLQKRLYVQTPSTFQVPHTPEEGIRAILRYVSRIAHCASPAYRPVIGTLWEQILRSPELGHLFFLSRYRHNRGKPNWYRVNAVMVVLLEHNILLPEKKPASPQSMRTPSPTGSGSTTWSKSPNSTSKPATSSSPSATSVRL